MSEEERKHMGERGRRYMRLHHHEEHLAARYLTVLERFAPRQPGHFSEKKPINPAHGPCDKSAAMPVGFVLSGGWDMKNGLRRRTIFGILILKQEKRACL